MKQSFILYILIMTLLVFPVVSFASEAPKNKSETINPNDPETKKAAVTYVNSLLQKRIPFLELGYTNPDDNEDESGFFLSYDYKKDFNNKDYDNIRVTGGGKGTAYSANIYEASIFAKGSIGLGDVISPKNKSEAGFSVSFTQADFGILKETVVEAIRKEDDACKIDVLEMIKNKELTQEEGNLKYKECSDRYGVTAMFEKNHINSFQWIYSLDAHAKIEGNEDYVDKHFVYGFELITGLDPSKESILSKLNIPDWPFLILRKAFGESGEFQPAWPLLKIGVQSVDVKENDPREEVAPGDDSFERIYGEIAFTTNLCTINGSTIKFNTAYEYHGEINADARIKAADLDEFGFFSASIQVPVKLITEKVSDKNMFFIRYTNGELPFDSKSSKTFLVGWQTNFNLLGLFTDPE